MFRIAVGAREREHFAFRCGGCDAEINGVFCTDQENATVQGIQDLIGASFAPADSKPAHYHTYNPHFLTDTSIPPEIGFSPFIQAAARHGHEGLLERAARANTYRKLLEENGAQVQHLIRSFCSEDWKTFDKVAPNLVDESLLSDKAIDRQRALFVVLELLLGPLFTCEEHVALVTTWSDEVIDLQRSKPTEFAQLLDVLLSNDILKRSRRDLLELIARFLDFPTVFEAILPEWDPSTPDLAIPDSLMIKGPTDFHGLKSLYVDGYETSCRALTVVCGYLNVKHRGNASTFPAHPKLGKKYSPANLVAFSKMSHAPKLEYLAEEPWLATWLKSALVPALRNAIGHDAARHDVRSGLITYPRSLKDKAVETTTYANFLVALLKMHREVLHLAHVTKIMMVSHYLGAEAASPCT